jgi:hypothetical protein
MSQTLYASGVFMGRTLNRSGDKVPPEKLYEACRVMGRYVRFKGGLEWDFEPLLTMDIDPEFEKLVYEYLEDVFSDESEHKGWKLPETTLVYPWIVRMFPGIKYIHWIRDPRDCILGRHKTDDLSDWGIEYPHTDDVRERKSISWTYQYELMKATPTPANCIRVRFEDFVLRQEESLQRLEEFLGIPLARIIVRPDSVGRWRTATEQRALKQFQGALEENGYDEQ